jgi:hypothetical protein
MSAGLNLRSRAKLWTASAMALPPDFAAVAHELTGVSV